MKMSNIKIILSLICVLFFGYSNANPKTIEYSDIKYFFPQANSFKSVLAGKEVLYCKAEDKEGNLLGVVFEARGKSYEGEIETLVGMLKDGTITAIKVLSEDDVSGLGSLVSGAPFTDQFKNSSDLSGIQAVSGATVSSQAVIDSVKKKAVEIKGYIQ